jgi:membrane protease subunit HflK
MSPFDDYENRPSNPFNLDELQWRQAVKWIWLAAAGLLVVCVMFLLGSTFYRVDASDEGVVLRFGKMIETAPPGLHWKLPWPIDTVYKVPVQRIQTLEFGFETEQPGRVTQYAPRDADDLAVSEMLTGDLNLGHVEWIVQYRVSDPMQYLFKVGATTSDLSGAASSDVNPAVPDTIRDISESVVRKLVGDTSIDSVLTIGRDQIAKDAEQLIQEELNGFEAGVEIVTVKLQTTSPPTVAVQEAFQEVNSAQQRKAGVINKAKGERNSKIPAARGAKDKMILEAEGYQDRVVLETTGKINAFLAQLEEYEKAPEITRKRLYLEAMEEVMATVGSKTIIDESVRGVLPMLNLDQGTAAQPVLKGSQR